VAKAQLINGLEKAKPPGFPLGSLREQQTACPEGIGGNKITTMLNLSSFIAVHFLPVRQAGSEQPAPINRGIKKIQ